MLEGERAKAKRLGLLHYYTGKACRHGHFAKRYVSSGTCTECANPRIPPFNCANCGVLVETPSKSDQRFCSNACCCKKWQLDNPDRFAAMQGEKDARQRNRDILVAGDEAEFIALYAKARRLTRETGLQHDVDHIVAIINGGSHTPGNLQVLPRPKHAKKTAKERWRA